MSSFSPSRDLTSSLMQSKATRHIAQCKCLPRDLVKMRGEIAFCSDMFDSYGCTLTVGGVLCTHISQIDRNLRIFMRHRNS